MTDLVLYADAFFDSPWVYTAFVALSEKGVPFQLEVVDLDRGEQRRPEFQAASMTARVPALRHGDFWLTESPAIVEYVDEVLPGPRLMPSDAKSRARARQVLSWVRTDLSALREERPTTSMFFERVTKPLSQKAMDARNKLVRVAEALVPSGGGPLFDSWSIADADLAFVLHRLILNEDEIPSRLEAYARDQWKRPSIAAFVSRERPPRG